MKLFKNSLFRNTLWGFGGNATMAFVSLIASLFVIRNIGPSEYGTLQEMLAYFVVLQNFENLVNPHLFKKAILEDSDETGDLVATLGAFISLAAILFFCASALVLLIFDLPSKFWLLTIMLSGILFRFTNGISFYFDSRLETVKSQVSLNLGNLISCIFKVVASTTTPTALLQSISIPIQYAATAVIHILQFRSQPPAKNLRLHFGKFYKLAQAGFPVFISSFIDLFKGRLPFIILGMVAASEDIGHFAAGVQLTEPWLFIASALGISFWPKLVSAKKQGHEQYLRAMTLFFAALFWIFLPIALGGFFLSHYLVDYVLGAKYANSEQVLKIQSIALLFQALNVAVGLIEINHGAVKESLVRNSISLVLILLGLYYLQPIWGIAGASLAVLVANVISCTLVPAIFPRTRIISKTLLMSPMRGLRILSQHLRP